MKKRLATIMAFLIIVVIFFGCTNKGINFKREDMQSAHFKLSYSDGRTQEEQNISTPQVLDDVYQALKKVKFNKKQAQKDIWTGKEIQHSPPQYHHTLGVQLNNDDGYFILLIDYDGKCYRQGSYDIYSETGGVELITLMSKYFLSQEESAS